MKSKMERMEEIARAICRDRDVDPDEMMDVMYRGAYLGKFPRWKCLFVNRKNFRSFA